jgi:hypothetical protein
MKTQRLSRKLLNESYSLPISQSRLHFPGTIVTAHGKDHSMSTNSKSISVVSDKSYLSDNTRKNLTESNRVRPTLYVKVNRARKLFDKDKDGKVDSLVEVKFGSSTVRTTVRSKTASPEWGIVFPFVWDNKDRYIKVEVLTEENHSLGTVYIPVWSALRRKCHHREWYALKKRVTKANVRGYIEIEMLCTELPKIDPHIETFYREVLQMPEFRIKLFDKPERTGSADSHSRNKSKGKY